MNIRDGVEGAKRSRAARPARLCNAADRPNIHVPFGLGRLQTRSRLQPPWAVARRTADRLCERAICPPNSWCGHQPTLRNVDGQLIPIASQRDFKLLTGKFYHAVE